EFHAGRTPQSMPRPVGSRQWVRMRITFLGHAGIYIETCHGSVLCDPWFTPAYFGSWFPFPRSDELDPSDFSSPDYLYISHSHRDHFDPEWLARHVDRRARVLLPAFNGPFDAQLVQFSGAIWYPIAYDFPPAEKHVLAREKRVNEMARAQQYVEWVDAHHVFPCAGPPAFLDDELFVFNDLDRDPANIFPDQTVFLDQLTAAGIDNAHL